ncbi:MAG TPA: VWA domain-containing protein [Candidatus Woesebacteria bacterium]|nr:VWA domain-containing protein [Candidatus Woesebacteria bacterium]
MSTNDPKQAIIEAANNKHITQTSSQALLANLNANTLPSTIGTQVELYESVTPLVLNLIVDSTYSLKGFEDTIINGINDCVGDFKILRNKTGQEIYIAVHEFSNRGGSLGLRTIQDFIRIQDFVELTRNDYTTDGSTPLFDATYDGITQTMTFASTLFANGATGVQEVTLILTDGGDNDSKRKAIEVAAFLKEFNTKPHFVAAFIGVNENYPFEQIAKSMGFLDGNIVKVEQTKDGIAKVLKLYSSSVGSRVHNSQAGNPVSSANFFVTP